METPKRKYVQRDDSATLPRLARCGHVSKIGRFFKCEKCLEILPEEDEHPDMTYHSFDEGDEDV